MKFATVDSLIQRCEQHLDAVNMRGTEIESFFVQYVLIRICAEYEERVRILFDRRCSRASDAHLKAFAQKSAKYICQRFSIGDIAKNLGRFGVDYRDLFHEQVVTKTTAHVSWDNIYTNRQAVAHGTPLPMSFGDLKAQYQISLTVLDALAAALSLTSSEISDLT